MEIPVLRSFIPITPSLLTRAQNGDPAAFRELDDRMRGKIASFVRRRVPPDAVDDVTQECIVAVWRQLPHFNSALGEGDSDRNVNNWMYTIARNRASGALRALYRDPKTQSFDASVHSNPGRRRTVKQPSSQGQEVDAHRVPLVQIATTDQYRTIVGGSRYQWALQRDEGRITISPEDFKTIVGTLRMSKRRYFPPTPDHKPLAHFAKNHTHYSQLRTAVKEGALPAVPQGRYWFVTPTDYDRYCEERELLEKSALPHSGTVFQYEEKEQ